MKKHLLEEVEKVVHLHVNDKRRINDNKLKYFEFYKSLFEHF